jgi:hypothetical protein
VDPVNLTLSLGDFSNNAPLADVTITLGDQMQVTDVEGDTTFSIAPEQNVEATASPSGYPDIRITRYQGTGDLSAAYVIPSDAAIGQIAAVLMVDIDPNKAIIAVSVQDNDPNVANAFVSLPGTTIDLDVGYDVALVRDANSPFGLSPGNTTLDGSISNVIFVNVDAGTVTPTITPPGAYACDYGWDSFTADPSGYNVSSYYCAQP